MIYIKNKLNALCFIVSLTPTLACAVSEADIDKLTDYSTMMGRALACNVANAEGPAKRVQAWIESTFTGSDYNVYYPIFMTGIQYSYAGQKNGDSPDTCKAIKQTFPKFQWPK